MKYLDLYHSELLKPTFVLNDIQEKIWYMKSIVSKNAILTNKMMTVLINFTVYDKAVEYIMKSNIIEDILINEKQKSDRTLLWILANIALTGDNLKGSQYLDKLLKMGILDIISDMNIYNEYDEHILWALSSLIHTDNSTYYNTQILYILLKMDIDFIHLYMPLIYKILRINNDIISTFILEDGLTILYDCFDDYSMSSTMLHTIFKYYKNSVSSISHLYGIFQDILVNKLTLAPDYETCKIFEIVLQHFDISKDIHVDFVIDNLLMNDTLMFYVSLELLSCSELKLDTNHVCRILKAILEENDDVNIFTIDCYRNFFTKKEVLSNLLVNDSDKLRKFIKDLDYNTKIKIYNRLDDTLFKKCLTICEDYECKLPNHLELYSRLL